MKFNISTAVFLQIDHGSFEYIVFLYFFIKAY